ELEPAVVRQPLRLASRLLERLRDAAGVLVRLGRGRRVPVVAGRLVQLLQPLLRGAGGSHARGPEPHLLRPPAHPPPRTHPPPPRPPPTAEQTVLASPPAPEQPPEGEEAAPLPTTPPPKPEKEDPAVTEANTLFDSAREAFKKEDYARAQQLVEKAIAKLPS